MKTIWVLITLSTVHQVDQPLPTFDSWALCAFEQSWLANLEANRLGRHGARGEHPTVKELSDQVIPNYECRRCQLMAKALAVGRCQLSDLVGADVARRR
jgi:hypothetical protein